VGTWIRGRTVVAASVIQQATVGQLLKTVVFGEKGQPYPE
jgi:hypothetical protein